MCRLRMVAPQLKEPMPVVIVLAAGLSQRFRKAGGSTDKLDALLGDMSVMDHVLASVRASGLLWHVVDRSHTAHLAHQGMGTSIACGVAATANASGWLVLPADLPLICPDTLRAVADAMRQHAVVVPRYRGLRGHPVGFRFECRDELLALSCDMGAKRLVERFGHIDLEVEDLGSVLDVDTPQALNEVKKVLKIGHSELTQ